MTKTTNTAGATDTDTEEMEHSLYSLADKLNELVVREQLNLQEELARVSSLIADAADTLTENFTSLNLKIELQSRYMRPGYIDEDREQKLEEVNREIDQNLTETVRSLQFEDIVQQLTMHSRNRAVNMESLFVKLKDRLDGLKTADKSDRGGFNLILNDMQSEIENFRETLDRANPVKQASMHEGRIELF
ncbi:MAG: hypothetical protein V7721_06920 [Porticoccaceae bacterium]